MRQHYAEAAEPLRKDRPHEKGMRIQPRKVASDYAFSAITPSRYSSDRLTIIDNAILLFECSYFSNRMIT